jgi:penicillin-binding protein 1B
MKVWSGIFSRLPSAPLKVADKGLDWQWIVQSNSTDAACPGARRIAFVAGFAPPYQPCVYADPETDPYYQQQDVPAGDEAQQAQRSGWRNWFGIGDRDAQRPQAAQPAPAPAPPAPPPPPPEQQ